MPQTAAPSTFEFTRRKRYADLLVTELSDAIILVLSPNCDLWYCGAALGEMLGYAEEDWLDIKLTNFIHANDRQTLLDNFSNCISTGVEMSAYARFLKKGANSFNTTEEHPKLFEINGRPKYAVDGSNRCICVFAVAKPYPGRSGDSLGTFLDLKLENQRLSEKAARLRSQAEQRGLVPLASASLSPTTKINKSFGGIGWQDKASTDRPYSSTHLPLANMGYPGATPKLIDDADPADGGNKKRKLSKILTSTSGPQYICMSCGRTDSPEWRKGPQGPKTLCNACGLRWAKESRRPAEQSDVPMTGADT